MVDRDLVLSTFWLALFAGSLSSGVLLLWLYSRVKDVVALMWGISALWLAGAFGINAVIRAMDAAECQMALVAWQRSCFVVSVIALMGGVDALVRAHNGQVPRIRRVMRWWERERNNVE